MTLDECLAGLVDALETDHRRVAAALSGLPGPAPRDPELAALVEAIESSPVPRTLLDYAIDHPEAAYRHAQWAEELALGHSEGTDWCIDLVTPQGIPLAS